MTIKIIFFDFDGTIADTFNTLVGITNQLAVNFGYKPLGEEELAQIKNLSSRQIIKYSGISIFKFPLLLAKIKSELREEIYNVKAFPEIESALLELKNQVGKIVILSSNSKENILAFLETNNLQNSFDFIYTEAALFSKSKVINRILKQENIKPEESIYIGDETRDIDAAKRSRVKAIAVSWGFNSQQILAEHNPDFLVHKPKELIDIIKNLQQV